MLRRTNGAPGSFQQGTFTKNNIAEQAGKYIKLWHGDRDFLSGVLIGAFGGERDIAWETLRRTGECGADLDIGRTAA